MSKTTQDAAYDALLDWLKRVRTSRNTESKGSYTMRALASRIGILLGRPQLKFSWIAKIEQKTRRLDILEYVTYCMAISANPHDGVQTLMGHLTAANSGARATGKARPARQTPADTTSRTGRRPRLSNKVP